MVQFDPGASVSGADEVRPGGDPAGDPPRKATGPWWWTAISGHLTPLLIISVALPLAVSFYTFLLLSDSHRTRAETAFRRLTDDSVHALGSRFVAYEQALDAGVGFFGGDNLVALSDWARFMNLARFGDNLPGINGVGFIEFVRPGDRGTFLKRTREGGQSDFAIRKDGPEDFIIKYILPHRPNREAVGLNIAFETNRYSAALRAARTGNAAITRRILLVQDQTESPGFLILKPVYREGMPLDGPEARMAALIGWVYAPLISHRFLTDLTPAQGDAHDLQIFDGTDIDSSALIYSSAGTRGEDRAPAFAEVARIEVMGVPWTLAWHSTPRFEARMRNQDRYYVLVLGICVSVLLGTLALIHSQREAAISARVRAQTRDIESRERKMRSILDTAGAAILLTDRDGGIRVANKFASARLLKGETLVGRKIEDVLPGLAPAILARLANDGEAGSDYKRIRKGPDGAIFDVRVTAWTHADGALRYTVVGEDVTLQTRYAEALEVTNQRWLAALAGAGIGVFDIDLQTGKSDVSATWWRALGLDCDPVAEPQDVFMDRVHPEDLPRLKANDRACILGEAQASVTDIRFKNGAGDWIWLRTQARIYRWGEDGRALRMIGTQHDITALKDAEMALKASHDTFRAAHEGAPVGIALMTRDGRFLKVNPALCRLLGHKEQALLNMRHVDLAFDEDRARLEEDGIDALSGETRLRRSNGRGIWVRGAMSRVETATGDGEMFVTSYEDISAAREIDIMRNTFISSVSHELRTPLTSIRGGLGMVLGTFGDELPEMSRKMLVIAQSNCERLIMIVNDILDMERLATGKMELTRGWTALAQLVSTAGEALEVYAAQHQAVLSISPIDPDLEVNVDPLRFEQIMANLISNAAKFSPEGGEVRIGAEAAPDGGEVVIWVEDDGSGIPPDLQQAIFDRFRQIEGSDGAKNAGTGLGLNISHELVRLMDGEIGVESEPGQGARFWVRLACRTAQQMAETG